MTRSSSALSGCVALVGGSAVMAGMSVAVRRTTGTQVEDQGIELRANNRIAEVLGDKAHVNVTSYSRQVLLTGEAGCAAGAARAPDWTPPASLPPMPAMPPMTSLPADVQAVLGQFATDIAGGSFVPGLYRLMAPWPAYLAHVATMLGPYLADPELKRKGAVLAQTIDAAAPDILAAMPAPPAGPAAPGPDVVARILPAIATYRQTSPQMVAYGTLLLNALPAEV